MAAPRYGAHQVRGRQYRLWLDSADGDCPILPCTYNFDYNDDDDQRNLPYELDAELGIKNRDDLYEGPNPDPLGPLPAPALMAESSVAGRDGEEVPNTKDPGLALVGPVGLGPYKHAWTHVDRMAKLFDKNLPDEYDADGNAVPFYHVLKVDPVEHFWHADERDARMEAFKASFDDGVIPPERQHHAAMRGIVSKGFFIISEVERHFEESPISEVLNAFYAHHFPGPEDELKYIFIHNIMNEDTRGFISGQLFGAANNQAWLPTTRILDGGQPPANVGRESLWEYTFEDKPDEYDGLLGTLLGRTVAYWMLGRYPRGSCKIKSITVGLSGTNHPDWKNIDLLFEISTTEPPYLLPDAAKSDAEEEAESDAEEEAESDAEEEAESDAEEADTPPALPPPVPGFGPGAMPPRAGPAPGTAAKAAGVAPAAAPAPGPAPVPVAKAGAVAPGAELPGPTVLLQGVAPALGPAPIPGGPVPALGPPAMPVAVGAAPGLPVMPALALGPPAMPVAAGPAPGLPAVPPARLGGKPTQLMNKTYPPPTAQEQQKIFREEKNRIKKRKAEEDQEKENDERFGKTRSGKQRKR